MAGKNRAEKIDVGLVRHGATDLLGTMNDQEVYCGVTPLASPRSVTKETKGIADKACDCWVGVEEYSVSVKF